MTILQKLPLYKNVFSVHCTAGTRFKFSMQLWIFRCKFDKETTISYIGIKLYSLSMVSKIRIGVGVSATIGPLQDDPNFTQESLDSHNRRARHHRERYTGVVVASVSKRLWRVYWDQTGAILDHPVSKLEIYWQKRNNTWSIEATDSFRSAECTGQHVRMDGQAGDTSNYTSSLTKYSYNNRFFSNKFDNMQQSTSKKF